MIVKDSKILILGVTFKENCPDIRNTKVVDIYHTLKEYTDNIIVYDPWAEGDHVKTEYGIEIGKTSEVLVVNSFDAVILAVGHREFEKIAVRDLLRENGIIYDVKGVLPQNIADGRL